MVKFKYAKGRRFEYQVRDFFERRGHYVTRSPKSSFPDLIIISPEGRSYFVECKNQKTIPRDKVKLLTKEEQDAAFKLMYDYKSPFFLFYKEKHKIKAIALGAKDFIVLSEMGL